MTFGQFYDGFSGTGNIGGNCATVGATPDCASNGWLTHSGTNGTIDISAGSLTYTGLAASTGGKVSILGNNTVLSRDVNAAVTISGSVAYYSALINVIDSTNLHATNVNYFMHFGTSAGNTGVTTFPGRLGIKKGSTAGTFNLAVSNLNVTVTQFTVNTTDLPFGTTVLVVVKFDISSNTASLWVNPTSLGSAEPTGQVTNNISTSTATSIASICIRNGWDNTNGCGTPKAEIDEIRVGATFAEVTPVTTSINEVSNETVMNVFPNPASDFVTISAKENLSSIQIIDIQGRIVMEYDFNRTSEVKLNVSSLSNGMYNIVAVSDNGNTFSSKLIK